MLILDKGSRRMMAKIARHIYCVSGKRSRARDLRGASLPTHTALFSQSQLAQRRKTKSCPKQSNKPLYHGDLRVGVVASRGCDYVRPTRAVVCWLNSGRGDNPWWGILRQKRELGF